jgi:hypothetical protein
MYVFSVTTDTSEGFLVGAGSLSEVVEAYSDCGILEIRNLGTLVPLPPKVYVNNKYKQDPGMENESVGDMITRLEAEFADACRRNGGCRHA